MKVLLDHAFYKKLLIFQEKFVNSIIKRYQDVFLELSIQIAESTFSLKHLIERAEQDPAKIKDEFRTQLMQLESKVSIFLNKTFEMNEFSINTNRSETAHNKNGMSNLERIILEASKISKSRRSFDLDQIPDYLDQIKEDSKNNLYQYQTISEVEEYVYQVMHKNRNLQDRKDASLEDLMAISATEHSQDLTNRIRHLIYMDHQQAQRMGGDEFSDGSSDMMPSVIRESKDLAGLFFNDGEDSSQFDAKKIKKIEFSQSINHEKTEKSLPFTHDKIDKVVFEGSLKDKEFNIYEAKELLKKVVKGRGANGKGTIQSEQSFENPGDYTDRRYQELSSLPSTIDDHFANIKVDLNQKSKAKVAQYQAQAAAIKIESKENLQDTTKHIPQSNQKKGSQQRSVQNSNSKEQKNQDIPRLDMKALQQNKISKLKIQDKLEYDDSSSVQNQYGLKRDQSQPRLVHNPSQINLAQKIRSKDKNEQSQEKLQNLQQQFYQIIQQQKEVQDAKQAYQSQPQSQQQSHLQQNQNQINILQQNKGMNQQPQLANKKSVEKLLRNLSQTPFDNQANRMSAASNMFDDKMSQDEEAIVIKQKRTNPKQTQQANNEKEDSKKAGHKKKNSLNRKASLPKIGNSFVQESNNKFVNQNNHSKNHSKKTSQSVLYNNNLVNISQYQSESNYKEKSNEGMKRSRSSAGFNNANKKGTASAAKVQPQQQQQQQRLMQRSQSSKKYQHLTDIKTQGAIDRIQMLGGNRNKSVKRLIILE